MPPNLRDHHFSKCVDGCIGNKDITEQSEIMAFYFQVQYSYVAIAV